MSDETRPLNERPAQPAARPPAPPYQPPYAPAYAAPAPRSRRGGLLLAGLALVVGLVAGTGGFALGHLTAGDGPDGQLFRQGPSGGPGQQDGPFGRFGGPGGSGEDQGPPER